MSIKNLKPTKNSGFNQGYYKPENPEKYVGPTPVIYRSSWEHKFMIWCDRNETVEKWSSEPVEVSYWYRKDSKAHKYYPDFYFKQKMQAGNFKEYLVEIKPKAQIQPPKMPTTRSKKAIESYRFLAEQYVKNMDKYNAAKSYADQRGWDFIILTEDTIKNGLR